MPETQKSRLGLFARQVGETVFCGLRQLSIISHDSRIAGTLYACPRLGKCKKCPVASIGRRYGISLNAGSDASPLVRAQNRIAKAFEKLSQ